MSKKRRTKDQKIIANLKRRFTDKQSISTNKLFSYKEPKKIKTDEAKENNVFKPHFQTSLLTAPELIKKNLLKTAFFSFLFFALILFIKVFFHL